MEGVDGEMTQLPNIITIFRAVGALGLLLCNATDIVFWGLYCLCGFSDIIDGFLARKFKCATKAGALLDSLADIFFVGCCAWKLLPLLSLPQWLWIWAGIIVVTKIANQILALVMYGECCFLHTLANKVTGFLLFVTVPITFQSIIPISITAVIATFAAIDEEHLIRLKR